MKIIIILLVLLTSCKSIHNNSAHRSTEAQSLYDSMQYQKASDAYLKLARKTKDNSYTLKAADSLRLDNNCKKAMELYSEIENQMIEAYEGELACLLQESNFHEAEMVGKNLLAKDATRWKTLNALGVISALAGRGSEAIDYFNIALTLTEHNQYIIQNNMALVYALQDKLDESIKLLENLDSSNIKQNHQKIIAMNLSLFYGLSGQAYKANEILSKHLSSDEIDAKLAYYEKLTNNKASKDQYIVKKLQGK